MPSAWQCLWRNYIFIGSQRIAVREYTAAASSVYFLFGDHLGSTSVVTDSVGSFRSRFLYKAWGELRYTTGEYSVRYKFTAQREEATLGLYDYRARFYDPLLGRFIQPDSIVPDPYNHLDGDRYSYVRNNPVRYADPTGHMVACDRDDWACQTHWSYPPIPVNNDPYTFTQEELTAITPDGRKNSFVIAIGIPSNLRARHRDEMKIPTVLHWGLSIVYDRTGGVQLYSETLAIDFKPRLELLSGEQANPSELFGAGFSVTKGLIWKEEFNTKDYYGEAVVWGGGFDILTADYYESFPNKTLKGFDIGLSAGSPVSGWRISTFAHPITKRFDITFWSKKY